MSELTKEEKVTALAGFITFPIMIIYAISMLLLDGFIFSSLWNWWIAPTFNIQNIPFIQAIAVSLTIQYFNNSIFAEQKEKNVFKFMLQVLFKDFLILFIAWILLFLR